MRSYIELIEIMHYAVLMEAAGRAEYLLKTYGPRLEAQWISMPEPAAIQSAVAATAGETIPERLISYIASFDPSPKELYTQWLVIRYLKGGLRLEDLEAAKDYLTTFDEMKRSRQLANADVNSFRSLADLRKALSGTQQAVVTADDAEEQQMLDQSKVLYDDPQLRILMPLTQAAACFFGRNTEWCTAWGNHTKMGLRNPGRHPGRENRYYSYVLTPDEAAGASETRILQLKGPLYIIDVKPHDDRPAEIYQYHSGTSQFMDVEDKHLNYEAITSLLRRFPQIMKVIGEDKFAKSHIKTLGLQFFSPKALEGVPFDRLIQAIYSKDGFDRIPENVKTNPQFLAMFLRYNFELASQIIPPENLTPAVAAHLREIVKDVSDNSTIWKAFDLFPMSEWSPEAVMVAVRKGRLTYEQFMALPEQDRKEELLKALVHTSAQLNPKNVKTFPPGLIRHFGFVESIVKYNPRVMAYLSPEDLTENALLDIIANNESYNFGADLAYLPSDRITQSVVDALNQNRLTHHWGKTPDEVKESLRAKWQNSLAYQDSFENVEKQIEKLPLSYIDDVSFFTEMFQKLVEDNRKFSIENRNSKMKNIILAMEKANIPLNSKLIDLFAHSIVDRNYTHNTQDQVRIRSIEADYRQMMLSFDHSLWTPDFIKTCITKHFLRISDIPDDLITADVAGRIFSLDHKRSDMAERADEASLVYEIKRTHGYGSDALINFVPQNKITEPVAFAAVEKGYVPDAKKLIPKSALSKRVYYEGVPASFSLNQVPKGARTDAVEVRAVSRRPDQIKFIANPLEWLNAHKEALDRPFCHNWDYSIETLGYVRTGTGFARIVDLPHDNLRNEFVLYMATQVAKVRRLFLYKGGKLIARMTIKNRKLRLDNDHPAKDLEPAFREIVAKHLNGVDITVLNRIGIYRNADGSLRDEREFRKDAKKQIIDGITWTDTAHLRGTLHTAWINDEPVISIYMYNASGWGHYARNKIREVRVLNHKLALAHPRELISGISKLGWEHENRWDLRNIGIAWSDNAHQYWILADRKVGKIGKFQVFYNPGHRTISIFDDKSIVAGARLLKSGKLSGEFVHDWSIKDNPLIKQEPQFLQKTLAAMAAKVTQK